MKRAEAIELAVTSMRASGCNCHVETITTPCVSEDGETLFWRVDAMHDDWCGAFDRMTEMDGEIVDNGPD